ncbi:MAG: PAS domain-containing protein, partial [Ktedonobacterales bacterium]
MAALEAALAAAERRAEEAERQLQVLRDRYDLTLMDGGNTERHETEAGTEEIRRNLVAHVAGRPMRLDVIFDALPLAVYVNDAQGNTLLMNAAAEAQLAEFKPPTMPATVRDIGEQMRPRHLDGRVMEPDEWPFTRILRGEVIDPAHAVTMTIPTVSGGMAHHSVTGAPLRDTTTGAIIGSIAVVRDVTEQRTLARR